MKLIAKMILVAIGALLMIGPAKSQTIDSRLQSPRTELIPPHLTDLKTLSINNKENTFATTSRPQFFVNKFRPKVVSSRSRTPSGRTSSLLTHRIGSESKGNSGRTNSLLRHPIGNENRGNTLLDDIRKKIKEATALRESKKQLIFTRNLPSKSSTDEIKLLKDESNLNTKEGGLEGFSFTVQKKFAPKKEAKITGFRSRSEAIVRIKFKTTTTTTASSATVTTTSASRTITVTSTSTTAARTTSTTTITTTSTTTIVPTTSFVATTSTTPITVTTIITSTTPKVFDFSEAFDSDGFEVLNESIEVNEGSETLTNPNNILETPRREGLPSNQNNRVKNKDLHFEKVTGINDFVEEVTYPNEAFLTLLPSSENTFPIIAHQKQSLAEIDEKKGFHKDFQTNIKASIGVTSPKVNSTVRLGKIIRINGRRAIVKKRRRNPVNVVKLDKVDGIQKEMSGKNTNPIDDRERNAKPNRFRKRVKLRKKRPISQPRQVIPKSKPQTKFDFLSRTQADNIISINNLNKQKNILALTELLMTAPENSRLNIQKNIVKIDNPRNDKVRNIEEKVKTIIPSTSLRTQELNLNNKVKSEEPSPVHIKTKLKKAEAFIGSGRSFKITDNQRHGISNIQIPDFKEFDKKFGGLGTVQHKIQKSIVEETTKRQFGERIEKAGNSLFNGQNPPSFIQNHVKLQTEHVKSSSPKNSKNTSSIDIHLAKNIPETVRSSNQFIRNPSTSHNLPILNEIEKIQNNPKVSTEKKAITFPDHQRLNIQNTQISTEMESILSREPQNPKTKNNLFSINQQNNGHLSSIFQQEGIKPAIQTPILENKKQSLFQIGRKGAFFPSLRQEDFTPKPRSPFQFFSPIIGHPAARNINLNTGGFSYSVIL